MSLAIYGAGGFAREVAPVARQALASMGCGATMGKIVFVSDEVSEIGRNINGTPVISYIDLLREPRPVVVAVADPHARRRLVHRCEQDGLDFASIAAATHKRYDHVSVGKGAIVCDHTIFTSNAAIGRHFHCNIYSYVAHDCLIGDFVTFAPRVSCNGRVTIEDDVYIGTGALLKPGEVDHPLVVSRGAVIGMGAVVTGDVGPGETVVGNPARALRR